MRLVAVALSLSPLLLSGCLEDPFVDPLETSGFKIELGLDGEGEFEALKPGDPVRVELGPQGADMVQFNLRVSVGPWGSAPSANVPVEAAGALEGGVVVAGWNERGGNWAYESAAWKAPPDAAIPMAGFVLDRRYIIRHFRIVFTVEACCYMCQKGMIWVKIGNSKSEPVPVIFRRSECPDVGACCWSSADKCKDAFNCPTIATCPVPEAATVCAE